MLCLQEKLRDPLARTHEVLSVKISPSDLGWPVRRSWVFCCGVNLSTTAWLGPPIEEVQDDFLRFFASALETTGDVFMCASESDVRTSIADCQRSEGSRLQEQGPSKSSTCVPQASFFACRHMIFFARRRKAMTFHGSLTLSRPPQRGQARLAGSFQSS